MEIELFNAAAAKEAGKQFVDQAKARLKEHWASYSDETKEDIVALGRDVAWLASQLASGKSGKYLDAERAQIEAAVASLNVVGQMEFQSLVTETLDNAVKIAGTFLGNAVRAALTRGAL